MCIFDCFVSQKAGTVGVSEFHQVLQDVTNFPLRPFVLPFLKANIPLLTREIAALAAVVNQGPMQYLRSHQHLLIDSSSTTPVSSAAAPPPAATASAASAASNTGKVIKNLALIREWMHVVKNGGLYDLPSPRQAAFIAFFPIALSDNKCW